MKYNCIVNQPGVYLTVIEVIQNIQTEMTRIICDGAPMITVSREYLFTHILEDNAQPELRARITRHPLAVFTALITHEKRRKDLDNIELDNCIKALQAVVMSKTSGRDISNKKFQESSQEAAKHAGERQKVDLYFSDAQQLRETLKARDPVIMPLYL